MPRDAHTPIQMEEIRRQDAIVKEREMRERVPEPIVKSHLCDFHVHRYITSSMHGMFEITQTVYKDGKKITKRKVIDGVFSEEAIEALAKAFNWRVYEMR